MKLYYAPGACSIGIHVLLEEIGKPYQAEAVNFREGAQYKPPFTGVNPKSKVPTLERDDGSILTEFPVIARWLAPQEPAGQPDPERRRDRHPRDGGHGIRCRHNPQPRIYPAVPHRALRAVGRRP